MALDAARFAPMAIRLLLLSPVDKEWALGTTQYSLARTGPAEGRRNPEPSAAVIDSQSVKTTEEAAADTRGYDSGKQIKGRKRHLRVDTTGLVMKVVTLCANIQDRDGAQTLFGQIRGTFTRLQKIWADGAYAGPKLGDWVKAKCPWVLEIVKRSDDVKGFVVIPKRWVVERTFHWLGRNRRLSKDYERLIESSEAFVYIASIRLMTKRLARS